MIRIELEIYLKQTVSDLETQNEPSSTDFPVLGNYSYDFDFSTLSPLLSDVPLSQKSEMKFQVNILEAAEEIIFCQDPLSGETNKEDNGEKITRHEDVTNFSSQVWMMYFDGSKSKEGLGERCILIDPKGKKNFLSYRL
jgi:hypothetical protein